MDADAENMIKKCESMDSHFVLILDDIIGIPKNAMAIEQNWSSPESGEIFGIHKNAVEADQNSRTFQSGEIFSILKNAVEIVRNLRTRQSGEIPKNAVEIDQNLLIL